MGYYYYYYYYYFHFYLQQKKNFFPSHIYILLHKYTIYTWTTLYVNGNNVTYFDSLGVEYIPKEMKKIIKNKNITTNIYRI